MFFKAIPVKGYSLRERSGLACPQDYDCHFRKSLLKTLNQNELTANLIWYIDPEGKYLDPVLMDAKAQLLNEGFPWFLRFDSMDEVLRTLLEDNEGGSTKGGTWGFGVNPSPSRSYKTKLDLLRCL